LRQTISTTLQGSHSDQGIKGSNRNESSSKEDEVAV
jgi:hypothetical protein